MYTPGSLNVFATTDKDSIAKETWIFSVSLQEFRNMDLNHNGIIEVMSSTLMVLMDWFCSANLHRKPWIFLSCGCELWDRRYFPKFPSYMIHHETFLIHHPPWCIINHLELIIRKQSGWGSMLLFEREPSYVFRPIIPLPTEHVAQIAIFFDGDFSWIFMIWGYPIFRQPQIFVADIPVAAAPRCSDYVQWVFWSHFFLTSKRSMCNMMFPWFLNFNSMKSNTLQVKSPPTK